MCEGSLNASKSGPVAHERSAFVGAVMRGSRVVVEFRHHDSSSRHASSIRLSGMPVALTDIHIVFLYRMSNHRWSADGIQTMTGPDHGSQVLQF